jgi:hypothetical protein
MKTILVNASAAKIGGAATVIDSFLNHIDENESISYIVICGIGNLKQKKNVKFIRLTTVGIWSFLFSVWFIWILVFRFRPDKIISFNNLNAHGIGKAGVTYFHQPKLLNWNYSQPKLYLYDWVIKHFLLQNSWVVQSTLVQQQLIAKYPALKGKVTVSWPGFEVPETSKDLPDIPKNITGIFPVTSDSPHKNIRMFWQLHEVFQSLDIHVASLLGRHNSPDRPNYHHLKAVPRDVLFGIYEQMDFLVFTSLEETVGLPVFEFLQSGKPAFVYAAPYAEYYYHHFSQPNNLILFDSVADFKDKFISYRQTPSSQNDFSKGEWYKVFDLL